MNIESFVIMWPHSPAVVTRAWICPWDWITPHPGSPDPTGYRRKWPFPPHVCNISNVSVCFHLKRKQRTFTFFQSNRNVETENVHPTTTLLQDIITQKYHDHVHSKHGWHCSIMRFSFMAVEPVRCKMVLFRVKSRVRPMVVWRRRKNGGGRPGLSLSQAQGRRGRRRSPNYTIVPPSSCLPRFYSSLPICHHFSPFTHVHYTPLKRLGLLWNPICSLRTGGDH